MERQFSETRSARWAERHFEYRPSPGDRRDRYRVARRKPSGLLRPKQQGRASLKTRYLAALRSLGVSDTVFAEAAGYSREKKLPLDESFFAAGLVTDRIHASAIARATGIPLQGRRDISIDRKSVEEALARGEAVGDIVRSGGENGNQSFIIAATQTTLRHFEQSPSSSLEVLSKRYSVATRQDLHQATLDQCSSRLLDHAISSPKAAWKTASANTPLSFPAKLLLLITIASLLGGIAINGVFALHAAISFFAAVFFLLTLIRCTAIAHQAWTAKGKEPERPSFEHIKDWPIYTVLVPLHREAHMIGPLVAALERIDYPRDRLDIKLLLESDDINTVDAARSFRFPGHMTYLIVPASAPQTKPKALNIGLSFARGRFLTIYDAEDRPEPLQLKKAVAQFATIPEKVAVLQARLGFFNWDENWLARQFSIEYAVHFRAFLPVVKWLRFPLPLGGTSNHFRMSALRRVGAWDAFNVTEDADLGIRLHRFGYDADLLHSDTFEEATCKWRPWLTQRTRWTKGWLQTWLVHMRTPKLYVKQRGLWSVFGLTLVTVGMVLSPIAHAFFIISGAIWIAVYLASPHPALSNLFSIPATIYTFNFLVGYGAAILLAAILVKEQRFTRMRMALWAMPAYWLLISLAALRAFWKLIRSPFEWEKTPHGKSGMAARIKS